MTNRPRPPRLRLPDRRTAVLRTLTVLVFAAAGLLMVTSAELSGGTDLRPGRYDDLADLARAEADRVSDLQDEVAGLNEELTTLQAAQTGTRVAELQERAPELRRAASLDALEGPGVVVTLDDAPEDVLASAGDSVNEALVHQQDLQAVANALWAGGAEAITIRGERIISTTGIKCVGNTVILNGETRSPPYDIAAIGDPERLQQALDESPYVQGYRSAIDTWQLGYEVEVRDRVEAPAYTGPLELSHATPIPG